MGDLHSGNLGEAAALLMQAKQPADVFVAWTLLKNPENLGIMISLPNVGLNHMPTSLMEFVKKYEGVCLIQYLQSSETYFFDQTISKAMIVDRDKIQIPVDYSIMFDTNLATYVNRAVRGEGIGSREREILEMLEEIVIGNLNFDPLFYLFENTKIIGPPLCQDRCSLSPRDSL